MVYFHRDQACNDPPTDYYMCPICNGGKCDFWFLNSACTAFWVSFIYRRIRIFSKESIIIEFVYSIAMSKLQSGSYIMNIQGTKKLCS